VSPRHRLYSSPRWQRISRYVRLERAGGACEHCGALDGAITADGGSLVRLSCAHLNGNVHDLRPENLRALCPVCHNFWDQLRHVVAFFERHPELRALRAVSPPS
jgi:5-methylcytosine-specific restriction endonuclease McrA